MDSCFEIVWLISSLPESVLQVQADDSLKVMHGWGLSHHPPRLTIFPQEKWGRVSISDQLRQDLVWHFFEFPARNQEIPSRISFFFSLLIRNKYMVKFKVKNRFMMFGNETISSENSNILPSIFGVIIKFLFSEDLLSLFVMYSLSVFIVYGLRKTEWLLALNVFSLMRSSPLDILNWMAFDTSLKNPWSFSFSFIQMQIELLSYQPVRTWNLEMLTKRMKNRSLC